VKQRHNITNLSRLSFRLSSWRSLMEETTSTATLTPQPLPFDLVTKILCWLPVKHLLQLRCVCKSWNSLISNDSNFARKHLRFSTSNHDKLFFNRIDHSFAYIFATCDKLLNLGGSFLQFWQAGAVATYVKIVLPPYKEEFWLWCYDTSLDF